MTNNDLSSTTNVEAPIDTYDKNVNKYTLLVALFTAFSRLLGFVRIGVLSAIFGASGIADIINLVLSIPNNLRKLLTEGALHNAYMPSYASTVGISKTATIDSSKLLSEILLWGGTFALLIVMTLSFYSTFVTDILFKIIDSEHKLLAANLFSYVIYYLFFVTLASILAGILQIHKSFIIPAISPILMSSSVVVFTVLFYKNHHAFSVIYGYIFGGILQVSLLIIPILFTLKYASFTSLVLKNIFKRPIFSKEFIKTIKRYPSTSLAVMFPVVGQQIAFYFSSTLPDGSTSAFAYAIVFWQLPIGIVINSIVNVNFSYILTLQTINAHERIKLIIEQAIEKLFILVIPISIVFFFFAHAGISITLQRGNLNMSDSILISKVLQGYAFGLFPIGVYLLFQKILIAHQKQNLVFIYAAIFTVIDIILSYVLINTSLHVSGLSIAYTLSLIIIIPIVAVHIKSLTSVQFSRLIHLKAIIGIIPLLIASFFISQYTKQYWLLGSTVENIFRFIIVTIILLTIILIGYWLVGIKLFNFFKKLTR